jgi:hypothetical protein
MVAFLANSFTGRMHYVLLHLLTPAHTRIRDTHPGKMLAASLSPPADGPLITVGRGLSRLRRVQPLILVDLTRYTTQLPDAGALEAECRSMEALFAASRETEENWVRREEAIQRLATITRGSHALPGFVTLIKGKLRDAIIVSVGREPCCAARVLANPMIPRARSSIPTGHGWPAQLWCWWR